MIEIWGDVIRPIFFLRPSDESKFLKTKKHCIFAPFLISLLNNSITFNERGNSL